MGVLSLLLLLAGCTAGRVDSGTFRSAKGYQVGVPPDGWTIELHTAADLSLRRAGAPGGMLVDASCGGRDLERSLAVLARHLTFGLTDRRTVESDTWTVDGRPAAHRVIQGRRDGVDVTVEAVVLKGERCVHDFLYVAPPGEFENGRRDFRLLVESFAGDA
jgi:hypothetical protein